MKCKKVKARLMALSAAILVALSTNTSVKAAVAERPNFSDVKESRSYYADICWAAERGIVVGNQGQFKPDMPITVQQFFTMLSRAIPESAAEQDADYFAPKGSMLYHLRRSIRNGWADALGATVEYQKDANLSAGYAWYSALTANGTQIYSGALYGEQSNRRTDGMNAAKKLGLAAADADAAKAITRAEAVQIIRAASENKKALVEPEIITEMKDTITGTELSRSEVNQVYADLMLVPEPIRTAFRKGGWKICFDADKIAAYSEQSGIWGIHGMTKYSQKTIYLADADVLLHEMGHYYQEKILSSGMDPNVYTVFEQIRSEEHWSGSMLADSSSKDGAEFFADAFAFYVQHGKVRSDPGGSGKLAELASQRYFESLAEQGWLS